MTGLDDSLAEAFLKGENVGNGGIVESVQDVYRSMGFHSEDGLNVTFACFIIIIGIHHSPCGVYLTTYLYYL